MPQGTLHSFLSSPLKGGRNLNMPPGKLGGKNRRRRKKRVINQRTLNDSFVRLALIFLSGSLKPSLTVLNSSPHILWQLIMLSF